jgi:hypothetical protein
VGEVESGERVLHLRLDLQGHPLRQQAHSKRQRSVEERRTLSLKGPWNEKRLRWMTRMGGSLDNDSFLTAGRFVLH